MDLARLSAIKRLLIANRGEIAIRIARGARALGVTALGVYSDADANAPHVRAMDDALRVGPPPASESYLDIEAILAAARTLRADAIHPGYGFLSERAPFARAVREAGLIFVGPSPEAIGAMGDKAEAKHRARLHDVPVVPGYDGEDQSDLRLVEEARGVGLPLLVKARAGGGGRGMRVVRAPGELPEAIAAARREAKAAFGDDSLLLERYLERPRHIEFQILGDAFGHTIHLGERECSIQRRHQKVIEEAPSTALDDGLRERMGAAAVRAARAVNYTNAGTAEFLLDSEGAFYFLEMNARLQVEHPVTELAHGIDLVAWQLRIAAGEKLTIEQRDVRAKGWAIEARVNAEDPAHDYRPEAGLITRYREPAPAPGIRIDSGVESGSEVSVFYDSMLAKAIGYGPDRATARARLGAALDAMTVEGIGTNLPLLRSIVRDDAFAAGATTTAYLAERAEALDAATGARAREMLMLAFAALANSPQAFRIGGAGIPLALADGKAVVRTIASRTSEDRWQFTGDFALDDARIEYVAPRIVVDDGTQRAGGLVKIEDGTVEIEYDGAKRRLALAPPPMLGGTSPAGAAGALTITAPMPGKIVRVAVAEGETVAERDLLFVLEAMKMEHRIEATAGGRIKSLPVAEGALVTSGAVLLVLEGDTNEKMTERA